MTPEDYNPQAMQERVTIRSLTKSHRTTAKCPDRGNFIPQTRRLWTARTCPRFGTGRHVSQSESGNVSPHSKSRGRQFLKRLPQLQSTAPTAPASAPDFPTTAPNFRTVAPVAKTPAPILRKAVPVFPTIAPIFSITAPNFPRVAPICRTTAPNFSPARTQFTMAFSTAIYRTYCRAKAAKDAKEWQSFPGGASVPASRFPFATFAPVARPAFNSQLKIKH